MSCVEISRSDYKNRVILQEVLRDKAAALFGLVVIFPQVGVSVEISCYDETVVGKVEENIQFFWRAIVTIIYGSKRRKYP